METNYKTTPGRRENNGRLERPRGRGGRGGGGGGEEEEAAWSLKSLREAYSLLYRRRPHPHSACRFFASSSTPVDCLLLNHDDDQ